VRKTTSVKNWQCQSVHGTHDFGADRPILAEVTFLFVNFSADGKLTFIFSIYINN
jgi:hypothetical protein